MSNVFRRDIKDEVLQKLKSRRIAYNDGIQANYIAPATRPNSYAKIKKANPSSGEVQTISTYVDEATFDSVYGDTLKGRPVLKRIEIERVGQDASTVNLHLRLRGEFECLDYETFKQYADTFCRTDAKNPLTVEFGHVGDYTSINTSVHKYTNVFIVYGSFVSTDQNTFMCKFEAITGGEAVPSLDIMGLGNIKIDGKNIFYKNDYLWSSTGYTLVPVTGIYELLLYDAQCSGHDLTNGYPDGFVVGASYLGYSSDMWNMFDKLNISYGGHIVVYKPAKGQFSFGDRLRKEFNIDKAGTREQEYYSLEYITARLMNQFGIRKFLDNYDDGYHIKNAYIGFPDEPYSYVPPGNITALRSANPFEMLICGKGAGKYVYENKGKDWDIQIGEPIHAYQGSYIDYRKILIHRETIKGIFENSIVNHTQKGTSETPTGEVNDERVLPLKVFCENLFNHISQNTGGQINLGLVMDDEDEDHLILRIIDLHRSKQDFNMWKFRVLTGDGSTQSLIYRSRHPSNELHAALLQDIAGYSRVPEQIAGGSDNAEKQKERIDTLNELYNLWNDKMPRSGFSDESVQSARSLMARYISIMPTEVLKENNFYVWLLEMSVVMDGIDGWQIGNHITSDNLPLAYSERNDIGFVIKRVHHIIENNHWRTELDAISTAMPRVVKNRVL